MEQISEIRVVDYDEKKPEYLNDLCAEPCWASEPSMIDATLAASSKLPDI